MSPACVIVVDLSLCVRTKVPVCAPAYPHTTDYGHTAEIKLFV
jgi:hypothetical protein